MSFVLQDPARQLAYHGKLGGVEMGLLRTRLTRRMSCCNSLRDNRELESKVKEDRVCVIYVSKIFRTRLCEIVLSLAQLVVPEKVRNTIFGRSFANGGSFICDISSRAVTTLAREMMTNPEEHPAACKTHLYDWVRLLRHSTVLAFELREGYWPRARAVLITDHDPTSVIRFKDPGLRQVCEVRQL